MRAEALFCDAAQVAPVQRDAASRWIVEPRHQAQQRAFSRSCATDECHSLAGLNLEADVLQNPALFCVAETYSCELDASPHLFQVHGVGRIGHIILPVENLEAALGTGCGALQRPCRVGELFQRLVEHEEVGRKNQQVSQSEGRRRIHDLQGADAIHECRAGGHECSHHESTRHGCHVELHICLQTARGTAAELIDLEGLASEGMNHPDLAQALLGDGQQIALALVDIGGLVSNSNRVKSNRPDHRRQDRQRGQREWPVHANHHKKSRKKHDDRGEHCRKTLVINCLNTLRVIGDPKARVSTAPGIMELERQVLQRRVKIRAQLEQ